MQSASEPIVSTVDGAVGIVTLSRPERRNALATPTLSQLASAIEAHEADPAIRAIVITGGTQIFAAGADLREMADSTAVEVLFRDRAGHWDRIRRITKPLIAAVSGYALGGGCELTMLCDIVIASETARFGQPEINVALIPGAGGTSRLTRLVGKQIAMDMVLTGRQLTAEEALQHGLASRVVPVDSLLETAMGVAREIADKAPLSIRFAKESIAHAFEGRVDDGMELERRLFLILFATQDTQEGIHAFLEKRRPTYVGR